MTIIPPEYVFWVTLATFVRHLMPALRTDSCRRQTTPASGGESRARAIVSTVCRWSPGRLHDFDRCEDELMNCVWITTASSRQDHVQCYRSEGTLHDPGEASQVRTPAMDRLAREGVFKLHPDSPGTAMKPVRYPRRRVAVRHSVCYLVNAFPSLTDS